MIEIVKRKYKIEFILKSLTIMFSKCNSAQEIGNHASVKEAFAYSLFGVLRHEKTFQATFESVLKRLLNKIIRKNCTLTKTISLIEEMLL